MKRQLFRLALAATITALVIPVSAQAQTVKRDLGVTYGEARTADGRMPLKLDLVRRSDPCDTLRPTIIMIHGGGFISGSRSTGVHREYAREFLKRGWNAASISYPLAEDAPRPSAPYRDLLSEMELPDEKTDGQFLAAAAAMEATADAMRFFVKNSRSLCADPERIVLLGSSAGAGTALRVGYGLDDAGIDVPKSLAVIDYWGAYRLDTRSISQRDAPLFIVHGTRDRTISFSEAETLFARGLATDTPMQLHAFRGKGHGWGQIRPDSAIGSGTVQTTMLAWLEQVVAGVRPKTLRTEN